MLANFDRMSRLLRCYAEKNVDGRWEANCLDLDVAVQGASLVEVVRELETAVELYVETVLELPESDQARLLNRPAPRSLRIKFLWHALRDVFRNSGKERAEFTCHCHA